LGDIVFVELPDEGFSVKASEKVSSVESVKAVSDINSPVSGTVVEINTQLVDNPEIVSLYIFASFLVHILVGSVVNLIPLRIVLFRRKPIVIRPKDSPFLISTFAVLENFGFCIIDVDTLLSL